jgi:Peptidase MA superfamily
MRATRARLLVFLAACVVLPCLSIVHGDAPLALRAESAVIFYDKGDASLAERTARLMELARDRIGRSLGFGLREPIAVRLVRGRAAFDKACGRPMPDWAIAAACRGRGIVIDAARLQPMSANALLPVLSHEVVHMVLYFVEENPGKSLPVWYHEGVAQWASGQGHLPNMNLAFEVRKATGAFIPFDELTHEFPKEAVRARAAYSQSAAFVGWLAQKRSPAAHRDLLIRYQGASLSFDDVFAVSFGASCKSLEREWRGTGSWLNWVFVLVHPVSIGMIMVILFFAAFILTRTRRRRQHRQWDHAEAWHMVGGDDDEEEPGDVDDDGDDFHGGHYMD